MAPNNHLSRFERTARRLIEGTIDRFFIEEPVANKIANELTRSIIRSNHSGKLAHHYSVMLDPDSIATLDDYEVEDLCRRLEELVTQVAHDQNLQLNEPATVTISKDDSKPRGFMLVEASYGNSIDNPTQVKPRDKQQLTLKAIKQIRAFFIVNGKRHISLEKPVTTIGRHLDNDIVLDELSVSRQHAQIRWRFGHFAVHDLGSTAGTYVNGERIQECILQTGDVILLGKASLIYGEDAFDNEAARGTRSATASDGLTQELRRKKFE